MTHTMLRMMSMVKRKRWRCLAEPVNDDDDEDDAEDDEDEYSEEKKMEVEVFGRARKGAGLPDFLSLPSTRFYLFKIFHQFLNIFNFLSQILSQFSEYSSKRPPLAPHRRFLCLLPKYLTNQIMMMPAREGFVEAYADEKGSAGTDRITPSQLPRSTCQSCNLSKFFEPNQNF